MASRQQATWHAWLVWEDATAELTPCFYAVNRSCRCLAVSHAQGRQLVLGELTFLSPWLMATWGADDCWLMPVVCGKVFIDKQLAVLRMLFSFPWLFSDFIWWRNYNQGFKKITFLKDWIFWEATGTSSSGKGSGKGKVLYFFFPRYFKFVNNMQVKIYKQSRFCVWHIEWWLLKDWSSTCQDIVQGAGCWHFSVDNVMPKPSVRHFSLSLTRACRIWYVHITKAL